MMLLSSCPILGPAAAVGRRAAAARAPRPAAGLPPPVPAQMRPGARQPPRAGGGPPAPPRARPPIGDRADYPPPTFATDSALARRLKAVVEEAVSRGVTQQVGVAVYDLATGHGAGLNLFRTFRPASVIKLAVLVAAYRARSHM